VTAGVYSELRNFMLAHRRCAGPRRGDASLPTPSGYSVRVKCGCGVVFTRGVTWGCGREYAAVGAAGVRELARRGSLKRAAHLLRASAVRLAVLPPLLDGGSSRSVNVSKYWLRLL
jgi:hypothetical protein